MGWNCDSLFIRVECDIAEWITTPIPLVDQRRCFVDIDCVDAFATERRHCSVETANTAEQINESETHLFHSTRGMPHGSAFDMTIIKLSRVHIRVTV